MLTAIFSKLGLDIVDKLLGRLMQPFDMYFKKQITMEELRAKIIQALFDTFAEVEKAHADALAKTYESFMQAMVKSKLMQVMWASVVGSQLFVLLWHQFAIPFIVFMGWAKQYPSSGTTVEWAYLLLVACLGMGPAVLRAGPAGPSGILARLGALVGKK